ncbi:MAG: TIGR03936 family radical SAM-associated protein [Deltaproteobacteria bacterium]
MLLRCEYHVDSDLRFLSNLDMMHLMERALRRARIPYALSEGFNPHLKLSLGTVLPVGLWGKREYFDLELKSPMVPDVFIANLNQTLPPAMGLNQAEIIDDHSPALMKVINSAAYCFVIDAPVIRLEQISQDLLAASQLIVRSRGKKKEQNKDLRAGIFKINVNQTQDFVIMELWVSTGEPVNVRYDELIDLLGKHGIGSGSIKDVYRSGNYIYHDAAFNTPLEKVK